MKEHQIGQLIRFKCCGSYKVCGGIITESKFETYSQFKLLYKPCRKNVEGCYHNVGDIIGCVFRGDEDIMLPLTVNLKLKAIKLLITQREK